MSQPHHSPKQATLSASICMAQPTPPPRPSHEAPEPNALQITWSSVPISIPFWEKLQLLCHSEKELKREGYVVKPLDAAQIQSKARCIRCGKRPKRRANRSKPVSTTHATNEHERPQPLTDVNTTETIDETASTSPRAPERNASGKCTYHTSFVKNKVFTCCGQHVSTEGCTFAREHTVPPPGDPVLEEYWQYHPTPPIPTPSGPAASRNPAPPPRGSRKQGSSRGRQQRQQQQQQQEHNNAHRFHAIALDCEMGVAANGDTELIRLTAVDFFSGAVLVDQLVAPAVAMTHYNTRFSGVTARDMREAIQARTAILGRDAARALLFRRLVGPDTVVVVHGGAADFAALRWIHPLVVDTYILEGYTGRKVDGGRSLQNLCRLKLGIAVQVSGPHTRAVRGEAGGGGGRGGQTQTQAQRKRKGHDSYEDAMAARELVVHWANRIPDA